MVDYLDNSLRDSLKNTSSPYDLEIIDNLLYWNKINNLEKKIISKISLNDSKLQSLTSNLFSSLSNVKNYLSNKNDKIKLEEFELLRENVKKINNYLKGDPFIKNILKNITFDEPDEEITVFISLLVNNLLNKYSKDHLKKISYVIIKSFYMKNYDLIVNKIVNDSAIVDESSQCINYILEKMRTCDKIDIDRLFQDNRFGVSKKIRYLYHIYKYFILDKISKNGQYSNLIKFYEIDAVTNFKTIHDIEREFFRVTLDFIVKVMVDSTGINVYRGFIKYFESIDRQLTILINERETKIEDLSFTPRYHKIDLGSVAIPSFSATVQKTLLSDYKFNLFPRKLKCYLENPQNAEWSSYEFSKNFFDEIKSYCQSVFEYIKNQNDDVGIGIEEFIKNIIKYYIDSISTKTFPNSSDIFPNVLYEDESDTIKDTIKKFITSKEEKYFVFFKIKDIEIKDRYMVFDKIAMYDKKNIHLGHYFEINDFFYGEGEKSLCTIVEIESKDKDIAITNAIKSLYEIISTSSLLRYESPFHFYGYQSLISKPKHSLEFHALSKTITENEYGGTFSKRGRERREAIKFEKEDMSKLSFIESANNFALRNGIDWFYRGIFEEDASTKLLYHWIGLEQLFSYYGNRNKISYVVARILINEYRLFYSLYVTYFSILNQIIGDKGFKEIVERNNNYKRYKSLKNFSLDDLKQILPYIDNLQLKTILNNFIEEFSNEEQDWIDHHKDLMARYIFKINRISSIRNRIVHSGRYDTRYYIFAEQLEKILNNVLMKLAQHPQENNFKSFFKKTEILLRIPFD